MNELYWWLAERYQNEQRLREASSDWAWLGSILLPVGGVPFVMLLALAVSDPAGTPVLASLRAQIPAWLPVGSYCVTVGGLAIVGYSWLLRRAAKVLSTF